MLNGLLLIDKPSKITSHDVVATVRRMTQQKSVGHAGTLDPLATGLMVVLMGEATKLSNYILNGDKAYVVQAKIGVKTNTGDKDGEIEASQEVAPIETEKLITTIASLVGTFQWAVPIFSAVKQNGEKLYDLARSGQAVTPPTKAMTFYEAKLIDVQWPLVKVAVRCSKGSFIRTWVEKFGEALGTFASVETLRRTESEPYSLEKAVTLRNAEGKILTETTSWIPLEDSLPQWPQIQVEGKEEKLIRNGQIPYSLKRMLEIEFTGSPGVRVKSARNKRLLAILSPTPHSFTIQRVFNDY
ncbi:MAG: tRNA pseudouridine(55) synthase TruB [Bdellovibrionales bacterium]|nr:tRNA pseudouridine(55) synthase TruB [Bdellovibrionales bacterium]